MGKQKIEAKNFSKNFDEYVKKAKPIPIYYVEAQIGLLYLEKRRIAHNPVPAVIPYTDVAEDSPYYNAVIWAYEKGIASDGSTFEPDSPCTRGQVITFMWRAAGSPEPQATESPFSDVSSADWFYKPALWAYENGVATSTTFNPGNFCTNGEALTFLWRAEGKPAAAVYSSPMALAAPDKYFTRPVAWAETNGLFAGADFDPAAPCLRADLMKYLCWLTEEWAFTEEDKTVQTEYEQIINDAQLFEVHGSGLCYADYVDVDGDDKIELLTIGTPGDASGYNSYEITATVYANIDDHVGKLCEQTFLWEWNEESLSICKNDNRVCLRNTWLHMGTASEGDVFYKIENGAFVINESISVSYASDQPEYSGITEAKYNALDQKYTGGKELLSYNRNSGISVHERGILPVPGVKVNGAAVKLSADPYYSVGKNDLMVPIRDVLEAMGVAVYANSDASVILASTKSDTLTITYKDFSDWSFEGINSTYHGQDKTYKYSMNGGRFQNISLEFTNGKTFVPLQTILPLFGATAEWDGEAGAMQITSNISDSNRMSQDELKKVANFDLDQAQQMAVNKGYATPYKTSVGDGTECGLTFKNGEAVWSLFVVKTPAYWTGEGGIENGAYYTNARLSRIEIASSGTVTVDSKEYIQSGGQV